MSSAEISGSYPAPAQGWYVIGILYLAYTLAFVDRQIMAFLVGPIRADFNITDFQYSLIQGLAFAVFYAVLGIPIARMADVKNRRNIIVAGVALWSAMTALCGLAANYWQLFLYRLGVGVGEASLSPSAISLIADYFPKDKRSMPINVYSAGVHGGAGMANIFGGLVVAWTASSGMQNVALLGELKPWQLAFMLVGLPGLLVALLSLTIREPARKEQAFNAVDGVSFGHTLRYIQSHFTVYVTLMLGAALAALASYAAFSWVPALYARRFAWGSAEIGLYFGLITFICGTAGLVFSGLLANRMLAAKVSAPYTKLMVVCMAGATLSAFAMLAVDDPYLTLVCLSFLVLFLSAPIGLVQIALQAITPNEMRAQVIAIYMFGVTVIGLAVGPSAVAAMTDYYFASDVAVGSSIAIVAGAASLLSMCLHWIGIGAYQRKTLTSQKAVIP